MCQCLDKSTLFTRALYFSLSKEILPILVRRCVKLSLEHLKKFVCILITAAFRDLVDVPLRIRHQLQRLVEAGGMEQECLIAGVARTASLFVVGVAGTAPICAAGAGCTARMPGIASVSMTSVLLCVCIREAGEEQQEVGLQGERLVETVVRILLDDGGDDGLCMEIVFQ